MEREKASMRNIPMKDALEKYIKEKYPGWDNLPKGSGFQETVRESFKAGYEAESDPACPDDCTHRKGRFCLLSTNHCTRMAVDFYTPKVDSDE